MKFLSFLLLSSSVFASVFANADTNAADQAADSPGVGYVIGKHIYGLARDAQYDPLIIDDSPLIYQKANYEVGLELGNSSYTLSLFDNTYGGAYLNEWSGDPKQVLDTRAMDFGKVGGVYSIGSAQKSAWNSVLFNEYALVDGRDQDMFVKRYRAYFKNQGESVRPYNYGWLNEVILLSNDGQAKTIKNFAAGRTFASSMLAMPDAKTFYFLDSHSSGHLYAFTADEANSFAKGELHVVDGDSLKLQSLGKSSALKMKFKLKKADFDQFFVYEEPEKGSCSESFTYTESVYGSECLKIQKKNRKYVGQFEPIRTAAVKGVKPFLQQSFKNVSLQYNEDKQVIELVSEGKRIKSYSLTSSAELGSEFLISQVR